MVSGYKEMEKISCPICKDARYVIKLKKDKTKEFIPCPNHKCDTSKVSMERLKNVIRCKEK